jgi:hypothetical protein
MAWTKFERVQLVPPTPEQVKWMANAMQVSEKEAHQHMMLEGQTETYRNNLYLVQVRRVPNEGVPGGAMIHLSIRRNDRRVLRDWRHLQQIKNEILGPEIEAVELFPAESRKVDQADQYHLWALTSPDLSYPVGYHSRTDTDAQKRVDELPPMPGTSRRPD